MRMSQFTVAELHVLHAALIELTESENHSDAESIIITNLFQELDNTNTKELQCTS